MAKETKLKCLRCGHEYPLPQSMNAEQDERSCPQCNSNSVRLIQKEDKQAS